MSRSMYSLAALLAGCALLPVSSLAQLSFQGHQVAQAAASPFPPMAISITTAGKI